MSKTSKTARKLRNPYEIIRADEHGYGVLNIRLMVPSSYGPGLDTLVTFAWQSNTPAAGQDRLWYGLRVEINFNAGHQGMVGSLAKAARAVEKLVGKDTYYNDVTPTFLLGRLDTQGADFVVYDLRVSRYVRPEEAAPAHHLRLLDDYARINEVDTASGPNAGCTVAVVADPEDREGTVRAMETEFSKSCRWGGQERRQRRFEAWVKLGHPVRVDPYSPAPLIRSRRSLIGQVDR